VDCFDLCVLRFRTWKAGDVLGEGESESLDPERFLRIGLEDGGCLNGTLA
jgi:hypothetical protein